MKNGFVSLYRSPPRCADSTARIHDWEQAKSMKKSRRMASFGRFARPVWPTVALFRRPPVLHLPFRLPLWQDWLGFVGFSGRLHGGIRSLASMIGSRDDLRRNREDWVRRCSALMESRFGGGQRGASAPFPGAPTGGPPLATDTAPASRWRSPRDAAGRRSWQLVAGFRGAPAPSPRPGRDPSRPPAGTARSPPINRMLQVCRIELATARESRDFRT